jgi:3-dehydroquinate synthase
MDRLELITDRGRCEIIVGAGALQVLAEPSTDSFEEAALIGDANVIKLFGERVSALLPTRMRRVRVLCFEGGEDNKSRHTKQELEDQLLFDGFGRRTCIVGVGGGISLDMAGFVAATYMRGIGLINVPTSLLAQVDAAVGGKTGVNTPLGKNLIGAFHQPQKVLVDPTFLVTLPESEWRNGLAEMIKHAIIADARLLSWIEEHAVRLRHPCAIEPYPLLRCLEIKAKVVAADERETGARSVLNFGHTVGHAIERASGYNVPHGLAVAAGMMTEATLAVRKCGLNPEVLRRLRGLWPALGFPALPAFGFDQIAPHLSMDKKRRSAELRVALPLRIGEMAGGAEGSVAVSLEELRDALEQDLRERG